MTAETVVRLAARGDGVTDAGRYVAGTAPGDIVEGDVVEPGPHRAVPPCRHFGVCGGCQLQHVDEEVLGEFVTGRVLGALAGVGIAPETVNPPHLSPPGSRRRASFRIVRGADGIALGFNIEGSSAVVDLAECHVVTPALWKVVQALRQGIGPILPRRAVAGIVATETPAGFDVMLSQADFGGATARLAAIAEANNIARICAESGDGVDIVVQRAQPVVRLGGIAVALPPAAFLQATVDGEAALQSAVQTACVGAKTVADLFCGVGTFALPLSAAARVTAVDAAKPAIDALTAAARMGGRRIVTDHRDLFRRPLDAKELAAYDVVVLDPPRAGAKAQVECLAASRVKRIAYVSCNPNTFARDAKILVDAGYRLTELSPVGQFRWSVHVELAAVFDR